MKIHLKYFFSIVLTLQLFAIICLAQQHSIYVNVDYDSLNQIVTPFKKFDAYPKNFNKDKSFINNVPTIRDEGYWSNEFGPYGFIAAYALDVDKSNGELLFCGGFTGLIRSLDGGDTWTVVDDVNTPINDVKIDIINNKVIAVGQSPIIYISTDLGLTWQNISLPFIYDLLACVALSPHNSNIIFVGSNGMAEILKSTDGGFTWQNQLINGIGRI